MSKFGYLIVFGLIGLIVLISYCAGRDGKPTDVTPSAVEEPHDG